MIVRLKSNIKRFAPCNYPEHKFRFAYGDVVDIPNIQGSQFKILKPTFIHNCLYGLMPAYYYKSQQGWILTVPESAIKGYSELRLFV